MTTRFALRSPLILSTVALCAVALAGCPGEPAVPPGTDAGPLDGGPRPDAPGASDTGPGGLDAGPADVDGGPSGTDAGPSDVDAGPIGSDAGPVDVDGGPASTDAGPVGTDAPVVGSDAGPPAACSPACSATDYCDLCSAPLQCVVRPPNDGRICPAIFDPVCGCDGMTYSNSCMLAAAGIGMLSAGECTVTPPPPAGECTTDADCNRNEYCATCRGVGGAITVCLRDGTVC